MELKEVFEPVLNFIRNLQKKDKEIASKQAAKDRLKLVLMQDRASVSPDFFELMKQEIIDVIKKYIEIDEESLEVELTRGLEAGLEGPALYANIPIKNVKPVAPKNEDDDEVYGVTEKEAEVMAEQILNQIEEVAIEQKEEASNEVKISSEPENQEKIEAGPEEKQEENKADMDKKEEIEDNKESKKVDDDKKEDVKKTTRKTSTAKKTVKTGTKTTTRKTTSSKTKK